MLSRLNGVCETLIEGCNWLLVWSRAQHDQSESARFHSSELGRASQRSFKPFLFLPEYFPSFHSSDRINAVFYDTSLISKKLLNLAANFLAVFLIVFFGIFV